MFELSLKHNDISMRAYKIENNAGIGVSMKCGFKKTRLIKPYRDYCCVQY